MFAKPRLIGTGHTGSFVVHQEVGLGRKFQSNCHRVSGKMVLGLGCVCFLFVFFLAVISGTSFIAFVLSCRRQTPWQSGKNAGSMISPTYWKVLD